MQVIDINNILQVFNGEEIELWKLIDLLYIYFLILI